VELVKLYCAGLFPWSHCAVELAVTVVSHKVDSFHTLSLFLVKMGTNQSYLFVLLLASLSTSCTSDCPNTELYWPFVKHYHKCAKLYIMLETALLANPENLYKLQDSFFPSSSSEPIYARVTFVLNKHHQHPTCWTSSVLLKSLDPSVLTFLQIQLLNLIFESEEPSTEVMNINSAELFFNLTVNLTVSDYSHYTINAVLQELTTWVSTIECWIKLASFPGLPRLRFLIACSMQKLSQKAW